MSFEFMRSHVDDVGKRTEPHVGGESGTIGEIVGSDQIPAVVHEMGSGQ